jgi:CIC family chloride channel protein
MKKEAASGIVQKFKFTELTQACDIGAGYKIMEIEAPPYFWDKSLKELNLKALYRIDVLLIKRKYPPQTITIPTADETIKQGDLLIIAGLEDSLAKITSNKIPT